MNLIQKLRVHKLFGDVDFEATDENFIEHKFLYFYADNGLGKTTLFNALFALLSKERDSGHKSSLLQIPFKSIAISLSSGAHIEAFRTADISGGYSVRIIHPDNNTFLLELPISDGAIKRSEVVDELYENLEAVAPDIIYVTANRFIRESSAHGFTNYPQNAFANGGEEIELLRSVLHRRDGMKPNQLHDAQNRIFNSWLQKQIADFNGWVERNAFAVQSSGVRNAEAVYERLLSSIADATAPDDEIRQSEILDRLSKLVDQSADASEFGLLSIDPLRKMIAIISKIDNANWEKAQLAARLYTGSASQRNELIIELAKKIKTLLDELNSYLQRKHAVFSLRSGLQIVRQTSDELRVLNHADLSSGERQIVMLFSLLAIERQQPTIIMIDEPELSLNTFWLRKLSSSMQRISADSNTQFLVATHSPEILSDKFGKVVIPSINEGAE